MEDYRFKRIDCLAGVGEARSALFEKKGIKTIEDLLYFFPRTHEDRSEIKKISDCAAGETVCICITVFSPVRENRIRKGMTVYNMTACDDSGAISVVWYNNRFVKNQFMTGDKFTLYGKITANNRGKLEMINPIHEKAGKERFTGKIVPIYPLTGSLTQKVVQGTMELALKEAGRLNEYIPDEIREKFNIAELNYAMKNIHFPDDFKSYSIARQRFVFEELLVLQLALLNRKHENSHADGIVFENTECVRELIESLPFSLTGAQKRTLKEILSDCSGGLQMNRLVQGDVGSGKTAVAAVAIYAAVKNGHQAAMMAPTEILASQHLETLNDFFRGTGINVVLLTGSMKAKEKRLAYDMIATGVADVIVGTHAIIQEQVTFFDLAFVVADEQHRFGVEQRAKLAAKGHNPHMLIMSATPIPRTLALILYGDLDISIIDELPPGRKTVKTYAVGENMRKRIFAFIEKNVSAGTQAYIVCPLIEETEKSDLQNAEDLANRLQAIFPQFFVGLMHGKMKPKIKDEIMNGFAAGEIQILVSTTVIEVGVNVPNANLMIIENAERFGLSQLHQLRGRVGRGGDQAYCILFAHGKNEVTKKRMETMCMSNDGFYISEQDLKLRGPGDFFGTRQHGLPEMKIANLFEDADILKQSQDAAALIIKEDRNLTLEKHRGLKRRCDKIFDNEVIMN
ncbi:MAG: ATP-dependent DNA helicase RecG [Oscillospiraceae bacterium]|nr:ATP-dependent DNA helicase RecG [Oscillospiraceae bacterium]